MSHRSAIIAYVVAAFTLACVTPRVNLPIQEPGPPPAAVYVTVTNTGFYDATVYAYNGGLRTRIGLVFGGSTAVIPVRKGLFADGHAQLYVRLIGQTGDYLSDAVTIEDGGRVVLNITRALQESSLTPLADPWRR